MSASSARAIAPTSPRGSDEGAAALVSGRPAVHIEVARLREGETIDGDMVSVVSSSDDAPLAASSVHWQADEVESTPAKKPRKSITQKTSSDKCDASYTPSPVQHVGPKLEPDKAAVRLSVV
eukprot:8303554-Pyramimonas_sp.AAC.1